MPKVSEEHLEARKQQIITAAFQCFARKGFHPTTMQDICTEAGLSAGAVYRYFASKEEIIASACDESQRNADFDLLNVARGEPDSRVMLTGLAREFFSRFEGPDADVENKAMVQLWAEVAVNDKLRETYLQRNEPLIAGLQAVVEELKRRGDFAATLDSRAIVLAMLALHHGLRLIKTHDSDIDMSDYVAVVEALLTGGFWTGSRSDG